MSSVLLEVVTPERLVVSEQVNFITVLTGGGELGILPRHAPLAATVKPCIVKVKTDAGEDFINVNGGFLEVLPEKVTILADAAELASMIDVDRARAAKERAEKRLAQKEGVDIARAEAALQRALRRLEVVELSNKAGGALSSGKASEQ
ncbi:F0F1 ATP synthase subunit epsilon [Alicyclobacillus pomorum]|jgi:F-type H+-transporting ATPase subunit epsilon|uniref:F0F1 ATP synthase subunit epsilon n=1 Tax=Alicyclobacillus pomorum TaxID=204470 RepID=UPI00040DB88E|nr:F0F1 ATP synthase subunit epsilon [Alicyclobacillus pomorum]